MTEATLEKAKALYNKKEYTIKQLNKVNEWLERTYDMETYGISVCGGVLVNKMAVC